MSSAICFTDATELAQRIRGGGLSPVDVVRAHLDRIECVNPKIHAIVTLADDALEKARGAEEAVARKDDLGPLHGVPFTVKDCFDTKDMKTTRGSLLFSDWIPETDATAVCRLKEAGGILIGKTNLPEFALRAETSNRLFERTLNPFNFDRTCGGSSGGEAAAISSGLSPFGIGTDLGGSNRLPAHYCGIVGFKPTHGRIPLTGSWPELMNRHMHVGPLSRTVRDATLLLSVLSGPDGKDPYAVKGLTDISTERESDLSGLRVGVFGEGPFAPVAREIQETVIQAASVLVDVGCEVEEVDFDWHDRLAIDVCMDMVVAEVAHYLAPLIEGRFEELSTSIQGLLNVSQPPLEDFLVAMDKRELLARDLTKYFQEFDLLLCPTAPNVAHVHEAEQIVIDDLSVNPGHAANITATFGLAGTPAISIPFGTSSEGLPIGVQVVANHYDEATLFRVASALETAGTNKFPVPVI